MPFPIRLLPALAFLLLASVTLGACHTHHHHHHHFLPPGHAKHFAAEPPGHAKRR